MKFTAVAAVAALGVCLCGCATVVNGTTQSISVNTAPVSGAACTLTSSEGTWYITTPGSAVVHKTKNDITAVCKKDGYQDATATIPAKFGATTLGNVILGGGVGLIVDAASGANYTYSALTVIPMVQVTAMAPMTPAPAPKADANKKPTS